jgi:hypothetical protein
MLGYTDPSQHRVWDNLYEAGEVRPVESEELRVYPHLRSAGSEGPAEIQPREYTWGGWDEPDKRLAGEDE